MVSANGESLKSMSSLSTQFKIIKQNRKLMIFGADTILIT